MVHVHVCVGGSEGEMRVSNNSTCAFMTHTSTSQAVAHTHCGVSISNY